MADVNKFVNYQNINDITTSCYVNLGNMIPYKTLETTIKKSDGYLTVQMRNDNSVNCESAIRVQFAYGQQKQCIDVFARYKKDCLHASAIVCKRSVCDFVENNISIYLAQIKPNEEDEFIQYKAGVQFRSTSQQQVSATVKYYVIDQHIDDYTSKQYNWNLYSAYSILCDRQNLFTVGDSVDIRVMNADKSDVSIRSPLGGFIHCSGGTLQHKAGERITARHLCFIGLDNKVYSMSNTSVNVNVFEGIVVPYVNLTIAQDTVIEKGELLDSRSFQLRKNSTDVLQVGKMVYAVFSIDNNLCIKSMYKYTTVMEPGYTYFPIGICEDSIGIISFCGLGRHFYTLDQDGKLTHIDAIPIA